MKKDYPEVFAKCRRGGDRVTVGQSCDGMKASNMTEPGSHSVTMKCLKCGFVWSVPVGGATSY